jgi:hypothetical protein
MAINQSRISTPPWYIPTVAKNSNGLYLVKMTKFSPVVETGSHDMGRHQSSRQARDTATLATTEILTESSPPPPCRISPS